MRFRVKDIKPNIFRYVILKGGSLCAAVVFFAADTSILGNPQVSWSIHRIEAKPTFLSLTERQLHTITSPLD